MSENRASLRYGRIDGLVDLAALAAKRVTLIGQGSMGQPVGAQLARHGVGTRSPGRIRLIDGDAVEERNLVGSDYRMTHLKTPKAQAAASIIREINPDVNVSFWNHSVTPEDLPNIVDIGRQSDLLCLFADSFDVVVQIASECDDTCPQLMAVFGPRCDYAEVAFSIPGQTTPLRTALGRQKREAITKPDALGCDTMFVVSFVVMVCLRLLLSGAKGEELLACFANAPLFVIGLRPSWIFSRQPQDLTRSIYRVPVSTKMWNLHRNERKSAP